jgi:methanogenic corrinoid protein MtbC1
MKVLSEDALDEMEQRERATTPGPWISYVEGRDHNSGSSFIMTGLAETRGADIELLGASIADQEFIAHAKQDMPLLISEVRRLTALLRSQQVD